MEPLFRGHIMYNRNTTMHRMIILLKLLNSCENNILEAHNSTKNSVCRGKVFTGWIFYQFISVLSVLFVSLSSVALSMQWWLSAASVCVGLIRGVIDRVDYDLTSSLNTRLDICLPAAFACFCLFMVICHDIHSATEQGGAAGPFLHAGKYI